MTIVRWDPFRDLVYGAEHVDAAVDIFQTGDHELVLKAELPDMSREDIDITVENFVLTVKGEKKLSTR
jgi:HSP20 family molecular chaperone IbpA